MSVELPTDEHSLYERELRQNGFEHFYSEHFRSMQGQESRVATWLHPQGWLSFSLHIQSPSGWTCKQADLVTQALVDCSRHEEDYNRYHRRLRDGRLVVTILHECVGGGVFELMADLKPHLHPMPFSEWVGLQEQGELQPCYEKSELPPHPLWMRPGTHPQHEKLMAHARRWGFDTVMRQLIGQEGNPNMVLSTLRDDSKARLLREAHAMTRQALERHGIEQPDERQRALTTHWLTALDRHEPYLGHEELVPGFNFLVLMTRLARYWSLHYKAYATVLDNTPDATLKRLAEARDGFCNLNIETCRLLLYMSSDEIGMGQRMREHARAVEHVVDTLDRRGALALGTANTNLLGMFVRENDIHPNEVGHIRYRHLLDLFLERPHLTRAALASPKWAGLCQREKLLGFLEKASTTHIAPLQALWLECELESTVPPAASGRSSPRL